MSEKKLSFSTGLRDGIPIGLGYLSVSFGFGIMAVSAGIPIWAAVLISMSCVTSAGQVAGVTVIAGAGSCIELAMTQLVINLRYALMGLSLSQKLDNSFNNPKRLAVAFGITDEIFAVASGKEENVTPIYMAGLISLPYAMWSLGTFLGAFAGEILPVKIKAALGMAIYGMFIAIIIPPAKKSLGVVLAIIIAVVLSCILTYVPVFSFISGGFIIIICAIIASVAAALLFPIAEESEVK